MSRIKAQLVGQGLFARQGGLFSTIPVFVQRSGNSGTAPFYEHLQSVASVLWIINHNLGFRPVVSVFTVGGVEMLADVQHISVNQAQVNFASPTAGFARLI